MIIKLLELFGTIILIILGVFIIAVLVKKMLQELRKWGVYWWNIV